MRIWTLVFVLSLCSVAMAGNPGDGGSTGTSATEQKHVGNSADYALAANQIEKMGGGFAIEAENIRAGNPTGQFFIDGNGLKYVFMVMKLLLAVYLPVGLS